MDLDEETKLELMDAFSDLYTEAEENLTKLCIGFHKATVDALFRAIHNIKGNAGIMGLNVIVAFTHEVEEVVGALRRQKYSITPAIADTLLIALDRLNDLHHQELFGKHFDHLRIDELIVLYRALSQADAQEVESIAQQTLEFLGAGVSGVNVDIFADVESEEISTPQSVEAQDPQIQEDLIFFQEIALQIDNLRDGWQGRSLQFFDWAMQMNMIAGLPVNELQLSAAIYMHDVGMTLMPSEFWDKKLELNPKDVESVRRHPDWGYQWLSRLPQWQEAAEITSQHHEKVDGTGYPHGISGDQIHPGAKILSILDTFFFLTKGRVDSSVRRSTVRALSAINARIDSDFDGMWVQCFNYLMRKELQAGSI